MKRIQLEEKPDSPFKQGLLLGIRIASIAFVPILLLFLGMIGYRLLEGNLDYKSQPSDVEMPVPAELEPR